MPGEGATDGQGLCVQEIPQEGWQESAEGSQERDHDLENGQTSKHLAAD